MAHDEKLEARIRAYLEGEQVGYESKRMFGGVCFLVAGKMALGIVKDDLMVRVGVEAYEDALESPHAREMDFTGKPLKGMVYVSPGGLTQHAALARWLDAGIAAARRESTKTGTKKTGTKKTGTKKTGTKKTGTKKTGTKKTGTKKTATKTTATKTTATKKAATKKAAS